MEGINRVNLHSIKDNVDTVVADRVGRDVAYLALEFHTLAPRTLEDISKETDYVDGCIADALGFKGLDALTYDQRTNIRRLVRSAFAYGRSYEHEARGSYDEGHEDGYTSGYEDGKAKGYEDGKEYGKASARADYEQGYTDGLKVVNRTLAEVYEDGFGRGYNKGKDDVESELRGSDEGGD